jgi:argininosuccinate synthase
MKVVIPYSGSATASGAIERLVRQGVEVIALTLDVGQTEPLDGIRARAVASGASRAHVVDAREAFVRTCVLPAVQGTPAAGVQALADPLIARTLDEVAAIEGADALPLERAAAASDDRRARNLLMRPAVNPSQAPDTEARLDITLEDGIPVAVNGVPMTLTELIESVSLIAGRHGIGHEDTPQAPAAAILRTAYAHAAAPTSTVRLRLHKGAHTVQPEMVTHS